MNVSQDARKGLDLSEADARAVHGLLAAYYQRTDRPDHQTVASLFCEDGALILGSLTLSGRPRIAAFFEERNASQAAAGRFTRHIAGPADLFPIDRSRIAARSSVAVFAGTGRLPLRADVPSTICDFDDVFVRAQGGRWFFESRRAQVVFTGPGAAGFARRDT